jgi:hydroxymethylpyrimidine/phosphomethylpyrimidine kinase
MERFGPKSLFSITYLGFLRDLKNCDAIPIRRHLGAFCRDNLGHFLTKVIQSVPQNPIGEHTLGGPFLPGNMTQILTKPKMSTRPIALTIAGFDPGSGAGITADLKTFSAHGIYGVACISALTVQSTLGVRAVEPVSPSLVRQTLECLAEDVSLSGIKIGMLGTLAVSSEVASFLSAQSGNIPRGRVVLDPVLRSTSGTSLLDVNGVRHIREEMLNCVGWITPNVHELAILTGEGPLGRDQVPAAAVRLKEMAGWQGNHELNVVVTGGHLDKPDDYLLDASGQQSWLPGEKIDTNSTHGTGCAFSTALLCGLISGLAGQQAVAAAKSYVTEALRSAYPVGKGKGPMNHLFPFDP